MTNVGLEYARLKQPATLELFIDKLKEMNKRTLMEYDDRWNALLSRHSEHIHLADQLKAVVDRVISDANKLEIRPSTYRVYKAAICYGLASTYLKLENDLIDEDDLDNGLNIQLLNGLYKELLNTKIKFADRNSYKQKTSSMKKKYFPIKFYEYLKILSEEPQQKGNSRFSLLWQFVEANLIIGLRPIEWLNLSITSSVKDKTVNLIVKNAKNSNGRANGEFRELVLRDISDIQLNNIMNFYINFQRKLYELSCKFLEIQKIYERDVEFLSKKQSHIFNIIFPSYTPALGSNRPKDDMCSENGVPNNGLAELVLDSLQTEMYARFQDFDNLSPSNDSHKVSLYSTRHQCIANAKSSNKNPYEIAGFFGHSSVETASRHYGKAWSGWSTFPFQPSVDSIKSVNGSELYFAKHATVTVKPTTPDKDLGNDLMF